MGSRNRQGLCCFYGIFLLAPSARHLSEFADELDDSYAYICYAYSKDFRFIREICDHGIHRMPQRNFTVDKGWQVLIRDMDFDTQNILRHARLPLDLFARENAVLTVAEYYRLWNTMAELADDPLFPLRLARSVTFEAFSPPLFACLCSPNLNIALKRVSQYKPLIGPMVLHVQELEEETTVAIGGLPDDLPLPPTLVAMELVLFVHIARLATRENIVPRAVQSTIELEGRQHYESFFGTRLKSGKVNSVSFTAEDARRPFLTANESMWSIFEPNLRARLSDLKQESEVRDRVRACLMETMASGACSVDDIAGRLGVSTRTLQRRLREEGTNFQTELRDLREELARHYLANSRYSGAEIAFLLGYDDPNSFTRAFHAWTGTSPELARSDLHARSTIQ